MKTIVLALILVLSAASVYSQTAAPSPSSAGEADSKTATPADTVTDTTQPSIASAAYRRPDSSERGKRYIKSMFGPTALAKTVAGAGVSTWRNSPEEWGDNWSGFGKRVASSLGKNAIKQTTIYGLDEALKIDSGYYRSTRGGTAAKIKNALISPVTARNREGKRVFGVSRVAGTYASSIVAAETWYPDRYDWKDGLKNGTVSLGVNAAFNLIKEFVWK